MIKAFLINRDLLTWPRSMCDWMKSTEEIEPIIIDNASTYKPLLEWYDSCPYKVYRLNYNGGHTVLWNSGILQIEVPSDQLYIVSDPDFDLSPVPKDVISKLKAALERDPSLPKVGLAIRIDDLPDAFPLKKQVLIWETPFWSRDMGDDLYGAPTDTTFALCKSRQHVIGGWRLGGPYTVRHLPFYATPETLDEELVQYFEKCDKSISTMARMLEPMVQEFRKNEKK